MTRRLESLAIALVLALLLAVVALDLSGHQLFVVRGASMEPAVPQGALVVARPAIPAALAVGDVVTFEHRGQVVTHRVARIDEYGDARVFTTKGDANESADPEPISFDDRVGLLVAQVPLLGYLVAFLQAYGRIASFGLAALFALAALRARETRPFPLAA